MVQPEKSYTKPIGNDDVRKNHPGGGNADYGKFDRKHPHAISGPGGGWKQQGQASKFGGDDARKNHPSGPDADYGKFDRKHPHQGR